MRARNGEHEIDEHAAVQRKIADSGGLNHFTDAGIDGVKHVGRGGINPDRVGSGGKP